MTDLSVLIAARNEEYLKPTVEDVLAKSRADTEVIVILDGAWANPPIEDHPKVTVVYHPEAVGQRGAVNEAARLAVGKYIMKLDAHCIVDEGFDRKLIDNYEDNTVVIPAQYNLHAFNWKCKKCGNEWYQSPTPTECQLPGEGQGRNPDCDSKKFEKKMIWEPRWHRKTVGWRFDSDLHFQYWGGLKHRPGNDKDIMETMSCLGACWFLDKDLYWELGGLDERHGSWGQMGTEIACKIWLSGGRLLTNKKTWFAHMFRTQGGDFGFPYEHKAGAIEQARKHSQETWKNGKWEKAKKPLSWLVERFYPVPGWTDEDLINIGGTVPSIQEKSDKGIIFYTDNQLKLSIAHTVQRQLKRTGLPIVSSSLKPMTFGDKNIVIDRERGYLTMFRQMLAALEALETENVFFAEHDVLYHPSHFEFKPPKKDVWYYNVNVWRLNANTGQCVRTDECKQVSGICVNRETAIKHYSKRIDLIEKRIRSHGDHEFNKFIRRMGFEPGTHRRPERVDDATSEIYSSSYPNIDIRHSNNLTESRWSPEQYVNKKYTKGWAETDISNLPGWEIADFDFLKLE